MNKLKKALLRLSEKEREQIKELLLQLKSNNLMGLQIKKLAGKENIFRVRKGKLRIIYKTINGSIKLIKIDARKESTYKNI